MRFLALAPIVLHYIDLFRSTIFDYYSLSEPDYNSELATLPEFRGQDTELLPVFGDSPSRQFDIILLEKLGNSIIA